MRRAIGFLTAVGGSEAPSPATLGWFPTVGAALGLALGALWWAAAKLWVPTVAAALVVAADLALTGLLHFDGLVDSADGLLPHLERRRRLAVMREPAAGAFGVAAAAATVLLRWAALAALAPSIWLLVAVWAVSRGVMAVTAAAVPYARGDEGLAGAFVAGERSRWVLPGAAVTAAAVGLGGALAWRVPAGAVVIAAELAAAGAVVGFAWRRIGGFTGDVLGAAGVVAETVALVVAAAKW